MGQMALVRYQTQLKPTVAVEVRRWTLYRCIYFLNTFELNKFSVLNSMYMKKFRTRQETALHNKKIVLSPEVKTEYSEMVVARTFL